mgnify:CR=1 FL=1
MNTEQARVLASQLENLEHLYTNGAAMFAAAIGDVGATAAVVRFGRSLMDTEARLAEVRSLAKWADGTARPAHRLVEFSLEAAEHKLVSQIIDTEPNQWSCSMRTAQDTSKAAALRFALGLVRMLQTI